MTQNDLNSAEARAVVRRCAHDLRNMINSMDLEVVCLLEDPDSAQAAPALKKLRDQLSLTERIVYSLSTRFREPSLNPAAAADIFQSWRQQVHRLGQGARFQWMEPDCRAAIMADFSAVSAVLVEICLQLRTPDGATLPVASVSADGSGVTFSVEEAGGENGYPVDAQQWLEWEHLIRASGGRLERSEPESSGPRFTRLTFAGL